MTVGGRSTVTDAKQSEREQRRKTCSRLDQWLYRRLVEVGRTENVVNPADSPFDGRRVDSADKGRRTREWI